MKKTKTNTWRTVSIFLLIMAFILTVNLIKQKETYNLNGMKIEKYNFDSLIKNINENPILQNSTAFRICNIKDNTCIMLNRKNGE
jgi:hypothetical protein